MEEFILSWLKSNWYSMATTLLAIGALAKYVVSRKLAGELFDLVHEIIGAKSNGMITDAEYADIGRKTVPLVNDLWSTIVGWFPNKSKS